MTDDHDRLRDWAGAYTIGALEPDDRREFEIHLRSCRPCQAEVGRLAVLPGLLASIDPEALDDVPDATTAAAIERRARADLASLIISRRRWRWLTVAAVAALVILTASLVRTTDDGNAVELAIGATTADSASIRAESKGWGTELRADLGGLPERERYHLWAIDRDGGWTVAATWGPTPTRGATVIGATSTAFDEINRILVTSGDRADVLIEATVAG